MHVEQVRFAYLPFQEHCAAEWLRKELLSHVVARHCASVMGHLKGGTLGTRDAEAAENAAGRSTVLLHARRDLRILRCASTSTPSLLHAVPTSRFASTLVSPRRTRRRTAMMPPWR